MRYCQIPNQFPIILNRTPKRQRHAVKIKQITRLIKIAKIDITHRIWILVILMVANSLPLSRLALHCKMKTSTADTMGTPLKEVQNPLVKWRGNDGQGTDGCQNLQKIKFPIGVF